MSAAIETEDLTKIYRPPWRREVHALECVSLTVERGTTFGLLSCVHPTRGRTRVLGRVRRRHAGARRILVREEELLVWRRRSSRNIHVAQAPTPAAWTLVSRQPLARTGVSAPQTEVCATVVLMRFAIPLLCLLAAGCGPASTSSVRIDPALATLVPADAVFLAGVRMDALRGTPVYQKNLGRQPLPGLDELAERTGIDPRKDLWELLVVSNGVHTAALARGKFAAPGEEPRIHLPGATRTAYKGYTLIGNEEGAAAFMNASVAVVGRLAAVRATIDARGRSNGVPAALQARLNDVPATSQIWAVATGGFNQLARTAPQTGNYANLARVFSMLDGATAWADLRSGLNLLVTASCRTDQDARTLADALRGLIGLGRLSAPPDQPDALRVYDAVQVEQQARAIRLSAKLSQEQLDKATAAFQKAPRAR